MQIHAGHMRAKWSGPLRALNNALLFPIPKPKEWDCNITNTRPIVLLETFRKLFIKLITNRLNNILSSHNILQYNNRAGLIGQSTFQPLQYIQHVIELSNKQNKPIWIGL